MKNFTSKTVLALAGVTLSAAVFANPYPYHGGKFSMSDDDVVTTTTRQKYSYSDDDIKTINKSYSDDDITKLRFDYNSNWESHSSSDWRNSEERYKSSVDANDNTRQRAGHTANGGVSGAATGHSNSTHGATTLMNMGGLGNPVDNSGLYIDNTDQNNNQFSLGGGPLYSEQVGGDRGDRVISVSGVGNTDGSAIGSVGTFGSNDFGLMGDNGPAINKSINSSASK